MKDEGPHLTATWYSSNAEILRDRILELEERIKRLEEKFEEEIADIHHRLIYKQDCED